MCTHANQYLTKSRFVCSKTSNSPSIEAWPVGKTNRLKDHARRFIAINHFNPNLLAFAIFLTFCFIHAADGGRCGPLSPAPGIIMINPSFITARTSIPRIVCQPKNVPGGGPQYCLHSWTSKASVCAINSNSSGCSGLLLKCAHKTSSASPPRGKKSPSAIKESGGHTAFGCQERRTACSDERLGGRW